MTDTFVRDFSKVSFEDVYTLDDPDEQVDTLNAIITPGLDKHASLKRTKLTRPPAPWMNVPTQKVFNRNVKICVILSNLIHNVKPLTYLEIRNDLKRSIKKTKRTFTIEALSSKRPQEV